MKKALFLVLSLIFSSLFLFSSPVAETQESTAQERVFVDDLGREVKLPIEVNRVAPSGNTSQLALYAINPEKLVGWGSKLDAVNEEEFMPYVLDLPLFGAFYGSKANLNKEEVIMRSPDVIIDIGEIKGTKEDMINDLDTLQNDLSIPVVFIYGTLESFPEMFIKLGEITGDKEQAEKLAEYSKESLDIADKALKKIESPVTFYYTTSQDGLTSYPEGNMHTMAIEKAGGKNAVPEGFSKSTATINMENLYIWQPDVILTSNSDAYKLITTDPAWQTLSAVKNNRVYKIPYIPNSFIDNPPAVQMALGLLWCGKTLYPDLYSEVDILSKVKEYYSLFYHTDITDQRANEILSAE